jgi:hypothetical protein
VVLTGTATRISELCAEDQQCIEALFAGFGGLTPLHEDGMIESGLGLQFKLPIDPNSVKLKPSIRRRIFGQPRN